MLRALMTHRGIPKADARVLTLHRRTLGLMEGRAYSSSSNSSWPEGAKAFQRKLMATLDPDRRQGRRLSKLEAEEVVRELDVRVSSNRLSASGIADIVRAFAESQAKLIKSRKGGAGGGEDRSSAGRESYIKPLRNNKKGGGDGTLDAYSSQFHPALLNLVSNFVRIMSSQRDKGAFNGVLFKYVANGIFRMKLRWQELGDTQKPFLEAFARVCPSIRKQDLDFIMGTLGGSGLTWYAIPHEVRGSIVTALDRVLRETLEQQSSMNTSDGGGGKEGKRESIHNTLYGMAQLRLSLTPQKLSGDLCGLIMKCVEAECAHMTYWRLARTVWHLARLSERGLMTLPPTTLHSICARLDILVQQQQQQQQAAAVAANTQNDMNVLWGLGAMGVTWNQLDQQTQRNLLILGERNLNTGTGTGGGTEGRRGNRSKRAEIAAHFGRLRLDLGRVGAPGDWLIDRKGGLLDSVAIMHSPAALPLLLLGIAKIVSNSGPLSVSQNEAFRGFTDSSLGLLESHLRDNDNRKDLLTKRELCNLLWSLGTLGYQWNDFTGAGAGAGAGSDRECKGEEESKRAVLPLSRGLRRLLIKQIEILFRRDTGLPPPIATAHQQHTSGSGGGSGGSGGSGEDDLLGYGGSGVGGGAGSILPHLSTNTLTFSSLQSLGSFRELLYPTANSLKQTDIYNWYGAIAALQVPVQALPEVCSNSLLVALAGDLSLEGPSTVAHVLQLLHSCGFRFSLSSSSSSPSSFPVSAASPVDTTSRVELPAWLVPELVRKVCSAASSMGPTQLLEVMAALSGRGDDKGGLCPDLNALNKFDNISIDASTGTGARAPPGGGSGPSQDSHDDATLSTFDAITMNTNTDTEEKTRSGNHRSSNDGNGGNQETPLAALLSRRLSQAISASLMESLPRTQTRVGQNEDGETGERIASSSSSSSSSSPATTRAIAEEWDVPMVLRLVEALQHLQWARGSSWSAQSVLTMHSSVLMFLLYSSDIHLQLALQQASPRQLAALRRYLGEAPPPSASSSLFPLPSDNGGGEEEEEEEKGVSLKAIPSLATDAIRFADKWRNLM